MKNNIMCVCVRRDTTSVGVYTVTKDDKGKIINVTVYYLDDVSGEQIELVTFIKNTVTRYNVDDCIIDTVGIGILTADTLMLDKEFKTPIYRIKTLTLQDMNRNLLKLQDYIDTNILTIPYTGIIDLNKLKLKVTRNGSLELDESEDKYCFSDLAFCIGNLETYKIDGVKEAHRSKIERNLREIVEMLIDDLSNVDKSNAIKVNELVRLIDKVNYIRGQY